MISTSELKNILIVGESGKMGQLLTEQSALYNFFLIKDLQNINRLSELGTLNDYNLPNKPAIIIDFSHPQNLAASLKLAEANNCALLCGTTGLNESQFELLRAAGQKIPIFYCANSLIGMAIFINNLSNFVKSLSNIQSIHVCDTHHAQKVDAPSGTAIAIAKPLALILGYSNAQFEALILKYRKSFKYLNNQQNSETSNGPQVSQYGADQYGADQNSADQDGSNMVNISFSSLRGSKVIGNHRVQIFTRDSVFSFEHECYDRSAFAQGALTIAAWLIKQKRGFYDMAHYVKVLTL